MCQPDTDSISIVFWSEPQNCVTHICKQRQTRTHQQPPSPPRSENYIEKSSDKFKWPEEISIHLGPVSSKPAVTQREIKRAWPRHDRCISDNTKTVNFVSECVVVRSFFSMSSCETPSYPCMWLHRSICLKRGSQYKIFQILSEENVRHSTHKYT